LIDVQRQARVVDERLLARRSSARPLQRPAADSRLVRTGALVTALPATRPLAQVLRIFVPAFELSRSEAVPPTLVPRSVPAACRRAMRDQSIPLPHQVCSDAD
jgi:hypothetical protein